MKSRCNIGVVVHASATTSGQLQFIKCAAEFLSRHVIPTVVLVEANTVDEAATAVLQACTCPTTKLSITQQFNATASLRSAVALLSFPYSSITVLSCDSSATVSSLGASLGCDALHLDPFESPDINVATAIQHIAALLKQQTGAVCVGYAMKPSRAESLARQGMLPFFPLDGIFYVPIDVSCAANAPHLLSSIDIFLHKPTDFLVGEQGSGAIPPFAPALLQTIDHLENLGHAYIVDPIDKIEQVLDRARMAEVMDTACIAARKLALPVRSPIWTSITAFPETENDISSNRLHAAASWPPLPFVAKPRVACGIPEAHQMAFVLHPEGLVGLDVPVPALAQEYIDHGGTVWKVYVLGTEVFFSQRRSTPNLSALKQALADAGGAQGMELSGGEDTNNIPACIEFDSLESLPVSLPWVKKSASEGTSGALGDSSSVSGVMRPEFLKSLAEVLGRRLGLTLFGFDVVFDFGAGEAVIIDINYFPSFRGIEEAPGALRSTLQTCWRVQQKMKQQAQ